MKKIIAFIVLIASLLIGGWVSAATCEVKPVCIDNNHLGIQGDDCKITSADEIAKLMGGGNGSYSCYIGCKDGACLTDNTPYTCTDTDGGTDYFVKGSVAAKGNGEQAASDDYCKDKIVLMENSCKKDPSGKYSINISEYNCPNGCANGACLKVGNSTGSTCVDSDGGKDIFKSGTITINGKKQDLSDTCGFGPRAITEAFCLPDGTYSNEQLECPGMCEYGRDGAYCVNTCAKSFGYYPHKTPEGDIGIAFLTKDCKWEKTTPCQSNAANIGECTTLGELVDTDGDGLLDVNEDEWWTDPNKFDTDGDGYGDMTEIYAGYNPLSDGKLTEEQIVLAGQMASMGGSGAGLEVDDKSTSTDNTSGLAINSDSGESFPLTGFTSGNDLKKTITDLFQNQNILFIISGAFLFLILFFYVYSSFCLQLIGKKLGISGLWMAWIPVANIFLTFKIAGRPYWWFLLLFIPFVNIIINVIPWLDISEKLGKSRILGILIILFPLNFILMGYLAFSRSSLSGGNYQSY